MILRECHFPKLRNKYGKDNPAIVAASFWFDHLPDICLKGVIKAAIICNEEVDEESI